jgi:hemerythrin-like domain-containing protein
MKATTILSDEHRVIEIVLSCLEKMTERALAEGELEREPAEEAVDFIRNFADRCHHSKEEGQLFPAIQMKGLPAEGGPVAVMLAEHEEGRRYVALMAQAIDSAANGDRQALEHFSRNARNYISLLRAHIAKEEQILFPLADRVMNESDQAEVLKAFDSVEHEHMGDGTHERYLKTAQNLAHRYGISTEPVDGAPAHGSDRDGH